MIIKCLTENTSYKEEYLNEHGLSLYIETLKHKVLFDTGTSDVFIKNASKLNIDLSKVDTVVISHGHNDHGGGLKDFLKINKTAKIYIQEEAFIPHYSIHEGVSKYIGLDQSLKENKQIILLNGDYVIDDELIIFNKIISNDLIATSNNNLYKEENSKIIHDDFLHEQNLIIKENNKAILIAGCAHRGIVNIVRTANKLIGKNVNECIGGFHLSSPRRHTRESDFIINEVAKELLKFDTKYYTCHCTGLEVFDILKEKMKDKLDYISAGKCLNL